MNSVVISEADLGIVCDDRTCTAQAHYVCVIHLDTDIFGLYCAEHTKALIAGAQKILENNDIDAPLHELVEMDYLIMGQVINA